MYRAALKPNRALLAFQQRTFATTTTTKMSNPGNVIGGHKANINNPNTSDKAKQHSKQVINEAVQSGNVPQNQDSQNKNSNNVAGGLKATVNNPNVSDEAKRSAKERLNQ